MYVPPKNCLICISFFVPYYSINFMKIPIFFISLIVPLLGFCQIDSLNTYFLRNSMRNENRRVIITTDIGGTDPDDQQSLVHLLLCANDMEIEGIICQMAFVKSELGMEVVNDVLESYAKVERNLRLHDSAYPTAEYLRKIVKAGQTEVGMAGVGYGKDTEGAKLIVNSICSVDPRPLWLTAWGGMNTIAQALWSIRETHNADELKRIVSNIRIFDVLGQCDAGAWIAHTFPEILYLRAKDVYAWAPDDNWIRENIQNVGPLGGSYPSRRWATEGDSPSFLYLINNGLNMPEVICASSWGGFFSSEPFTNLSGMDWVNRNNLDELKYSPYSMYSNPTGKLTMMRWSEAIRNDFAAKVKWSVSDYSEANHHPKIKLAQEQSESKDYVPLNANAGDSIIVDASKSFDPDGDALRYNFYLDDLGRGIQYGIQIFCLGNGTYKIALPATIKPQHYHFILEVIDDGVPVLTSYRRIIVNIGGNS